MLTNLKTKLANLWANVIRPQLTPSRIVPLTGHLLAAVIGLGTSWLATKGWLSLDTAQVLVVVGPIVTGIEASVLHWQKGQREFAARGDAPQVKAAPKRKAAAKK